ncbi:MAG TPA: chemotaxis protein CheW [Gammaproteobacteria bacterium]|nr:chemotaxis protein CheW [Gammaproteobacteria bacterium]
MNANAASDSSALAGLADRPFELLKALEARARAAVVSDSGAGAESDEEWVGLGFRVGEMNLVVAREQVRELMHYPGAHPVPGAKDWLLGIANVRGQLLPISDMKQFLGGGESIISRSTRVLAVDHPEMPAGLLVDEVFGFRRFHDGDSSDFDSASLPATDAWLSGGYRRGENVWGVINLQALVEDPAFLQAAK